jgi:DNA-binding NarL/FixJ family response regulator
MSHREPNRPATVATPEVLLIGQHRDLSSALTRWLSASLAPCRILTAWTGEQGLAAVRLHGPQAVLIGLHLHDMSGTEATRRIKTERPTTAVVMFSLHDAEAYRSEALRAGANGYVLQSRAAYDLLPLLRRLLHKSNGRCEERRESVTSATGNN